MGICPRCKSRIHRNGNHRKIRGVWQHIRCPLTRRAFLAGTLALFGCGGGKKGGSGPTPIGDDTEPVVVAPSPIGYSHVLRLTGPLAQEVADAGGRLVMAETTGSGTGLSGVSPANARAAADVMRRADGLLLLVGLNWNDRDWHRRSEIAYLAHVDTLLREVGVEQILFEPVSEPWVGDEDGTSSLARRWFDLGASRWRAAGGTVIGPLQHPCNLAQTRAMLTSGQITVMDCTPVLASRLAEQDVKDLVRLAASLKSTFLLYETFSSVPWNSTIIRWMGEALRGK